MQVWSVLHVARWKYRKQKWRKKSPSAYYRTTLSGCIFATKACIDNRKNLLSSNISSRCLHNMANFGPVMNEIRWRFRAHHQISTGFASLLHYCSDVAHWRPTKLCTMFGRLLCWHAVYALSAAHAPWQNFAMCKIHFTSKSCVLVYWHRYCMALQQRALAKLCGMVQGMELGNFCREGVTYIRQGGHHVGHRPTFLVIWMLS